MRRDEVYMHFKSHFFITILAIQSREINVCINQWQVSTRGHDFTESSRFQSPPPRIAASFADFDVTIVGITLIRTKVARACAALSVSTSCFHFLSVGRINAEFFLPLYEKLYNYKKCYKNSVFFLTLIT